MYIWYLVWLDPRLGRPASLRSKLGPATGRIGIGTFFLLFLCYFEKVLWTNFVEKKKLKFRHLYFTYMNNMWQVVGIWTRAAATASRIGFWNWNPWCCYRKPHMLIVGIWTRAAATANHGYTICQIWNDKIAKYMRHIYKCEKVKLTIVVEGSCV